MSTAEDGRIVSLREAYARFEACAETLSDERFVAPMGGWSPRSVVAHLIGWNRHTADGCRQILRGVRPFYLEDEANDFASVNRASVERYASLDRAELFRELRASFDELTGFLLRLPDAQHDWDRAIDYKGHVISVEDNVEGLRADYDRHREAIEAWRAKAEG